jgi:hypothetical protein
VHCVIPAGGLSLDHTRWVRSQNRFFLPLKVLSRVFRGKFVAGLKQAFQNRRLNLHGTLAPLAQPKIFTAWLRLLFRKDWVVYAKRPFGGPEYVLQYLGRYTHRVAISNHRLVSFTDGQGTFRWRDSAHNNEQKLMSLALNEFLRRFLLHLLPKGFVRIRNFGFLANRRRATLLPLCFQLLGATPEPLVGQDTSSNQDSSGVWRCPKCGGPMVVVGRLTAAEIQLRSPPLLTAAAGSNAPQLESFARLTPLPTSAPGHTTNPCFSLLEPYSSVAANFWAHNIHTCGPLTSPSNIPYRVLSSFNPHRARVRRTRGFLLTALSNARRTPRLTIRLRLNAPPIKRAGDPCHPVCVT